jgi:S1-C subfamily serine protease
MSQGTTYPPPMYWPPAPTPQPPPRRRAAWVVLAVAVGLVVLLAIAVGAFLIGRATRNPAQTTSGYTGPSTGTGVSGASDSQVADVASKVDPGIVDVNTQLGYQNGAAAGTGIVLSADGLVLTNNHVVSGATAISVTDLGNGKTYQASVVGYDRSHDVAVIKLSGASGLKVAPLGDSSKVKAGDSIVAIGNAGGTGGTPSAVGGSVTALDQSITASDESTGSAEQLTGLIEVAADIQAGDSGGPLATTAGKVVGMDTAASAGFSYRSAAGSGDGYAIPINTALTIAKQIESGTASTTVHIGGTAFLGIETGDQQGVGGAAVLGVVSGSPAEAAGLTRGDVIVSVDGQAVDSPTTLTGLLDQYHPGDHLTIGWTDGNGQSQTTTITAANGPVG